MREDTRNENQIIPGGDGFDDTDAGDRLIQGVIVRCVDGHWSLKDETPIPADTRFIVLGTTTALQHWQDQKPIETIIKKFGEPLPDVTELNDQIPQDEWEEGLDGEPRPPWVKQFVVYLLNPKDASIVTYLNSTVGAAIAVDRLRDRVRWMRALRGGQVHPVVTLDSKPMKTKFGQKMRPEFTIIEWRDIAALKAAPATPALEHNVGKPVTPPSTKEEMNDEMPF
jgi:hypothetical protein